MTDTNEKDLLKRLETLSQKAKVHNKKQDEIKGYRKAQVATIMKVSAQLKEQGIDTGLVLQDETTIEPASIKKFNKVLAELKAEKEAEAEKLERFFRAVEEADYDTIKEITGQDVSTESFEVELESTKELKAKAVEASQDIISQGVSSVSSEEVLEVEPTSTSQEDDDDDDFDFDLGDDFGIDDEDAEVSDDEAETTTKEAEDSSEDSNDVSFDDDDDDDDFLASFMEALED